MSEAVTRARLAGLSAEEAAALWLVQQDSGAVVEAGLFDEWLAADPANEAAWAQVIGIWEAFDEPDDALAALREEAQAHVAQGDRRQGVARRWGAAIAAAVLVLLVGTVFLFQRGPAPPEGPYFARTYVTGPGQIQAISLPDGSLIVAQGATRLDVALANSSRSVVLARGSALFDVARDEASPFSVTAAARVVRALGTRFSVEHREGAFLVALYEGRVSVSGGGAEPVVLEPGQQLRASAGQADVVSPIADAGMGEAAGDDPGAGQVQFDNAPLSEAIAKVNAASMMKIEIRDEQVAAMRISGSFRADDAERFARSVSRLLPVRVVRRSPLMIELVRR